MASEYFEPTVLFINLPFLFDLLVLELFYPPALLFLLYFYLVVIAGIGKGGNGEKQH